MLLLSARQMLSRGTKSVLCQHHVTKHFLNGAFARRPDRSNSTDSDRQMSTKDVVFRPSNMYNKKKNQTQKLRIVDLVLAEAHPGAAGAVVINGWHTSASEERIHCTVDYTDSDNRRIMRDHIYKESTKKK